MTNYQSRASGRFLSTLLLVALAGICNAQTAIADFRHNLDKRLSLEVKQLPVSEVLTKMSIAGDFYFSYSGVLFKQDSLVNMQVKNIAVRDALDKLFEGKVAYKETGEYIILRYAANHFTIEPESITSSEKLYSISGHVIDAKTGQTVKQASVYEKRLMQSALTDNDGRFELRFKGAVNEVMLTASKASYRDTTLIFLSDIKIKPEGYKDANDEKGNFFSNSIENLGISKFFISSRQKIQSLNIPAFLANSPFQASLLPGLSSQGTMSAQLINKGSLNVLGGYTAGVNGVEIAGLFNITRGDVRKFQAAGLFNGVGGNVHGFQVAGLLNDVRLDVNGLQAAGLFNHVRKTADGLQVAGLGNLASKGLKGTQIAGLINVSGKGSDGMQIAGLGNITFNHLKGMQIGGLINFARDMDGVQIGLINISKRSTGTSIGLLNYVRHGYHKVSLFANEMVNANVSLKTGNARLYNVLFVGKNFSNTARLETLGWGIGHDFIVSERFSIAGEFSAQYLHLGNWDYANILNRFQAKLQYQLFKGCTLFCGPVYSVYTSDAPAGSSAEGYKQEVPPAKHHQFTSGIKGWMGWNVGLTVF